MATTLYLNLGLPWTIERSDDDTHTVITPCCGGDPSEPLLVVETPEQIAAMASQTMQVVTVHVRETVEEILKLLS